jgi:hypothetical protein
MKLEREQLVKMLEEKFGVGGVRVADVRKLKYDLTTQFSNILLLASTVSWAAMAVASLGVTNTMMASIRSRRWQFGVLRSLGTTRASLLRLVLAEATLLGLIACAIGLACGLTMAVNARGMSRMVIGFNPPIQVPCWHRSFRHGRPQERNRCRSCRQAGRRRRPVHSDPAFGCVSYRIVAAIALVARCDDATDIISAGCFRRHRV